MKQLLVLLTFAIAFVHFSFGQTSDIPLHEIKFSHEIAQQLADGKLSEPTAACFYSFIGQNRQALQTYELETLDWGLDSMSVADSLRFLEFHPIDAVDYLAKRLSREQIVIISEAHANPQHRVFTRRLLKSLRENGFRHIGLETITSSFEDSTQFLEDTLLNKRGYPLNSPISGMYTREPQMANLVREAIELGFTVFGYEKTTQKTDRDLQQALNIQHYLAEHPNEKIVIHCGYYHAVESSFPKGKNGNYMAYHLKKLTEIDPFTIYQDALSEKLKQPESPYYKMVNAVESSVLVDENAHLFNGFDTIAHFDALIYHPRTKFVKGRPDWLASLPGNHFVAIDQQKIANENYPTIVQAFLTSEDANATPLDMVEILSKSEEKALLLKTGNYRIRILDKNRQVIEYEQKVPLN